MDRHLFDGVGRVAVKDLAGVSVRSWLPPIINKAGHLVQAQPREDHGRRDGADARAPESPQEKTRTERVDEGFQEGLQQGQIEGRKSGFEQGQAEGLAQGIQQGLQRGQQQVNARIARLDEVLTHLTHALNEEDYKLEQALLNLVRSIASAVVGRELQIDSRHILQVVREALAALPPTRDNVRIFVNPGDVDLLEEARARSGDNWRVLADEAVNRGGCRIETEQSLVDFTVEARFREMIDQVLARALTQGAVPEEFEVAPEPLIRRPALVDEAPVEEVPEEAEPGLLDEVESLRAGTAAATVTDPVSGNTSVPEN